MVGPDNSDRSTLSRRAVIAGGAASLATTVLGATRVGAAGAVSPTRRAAATPLGARLYEVVNGWSRWPIHRTGTGTEAAALSWFESELRSRGARTGRWSFEYPHYDWAAQVWVGGRKVPTVPFYYEAVGSYTTDRPFLRSATISDTGGNTEVEAAVSEAQKSGAEMAVLPVSNAIGDYPIYDGLVAINRDPATETSGVPTLLIPGRVADQAAEQGVRAALDARTVTRRSHNVTGWFGAPVDDPIVVTTPLSGWFTCAAERGTGIAIALELAASLAQTHPVFFLGNSGHELANYGAQAWLADAFDLNPAAVFHIGASIAAGATDANGQFGLASTRISASNPGFDSVPGLTEAVQQGNFTPIDHFLGEAIEWSQTLDASVPLLSFAGWFPQFHTPDDLPHITTSPQLLETAYHSVHDAVQALLDAV